MRYNFYLSLTLAALFFTVQLRAQTVPTPDHVLVVVMENHGYSEIIGSGTGAPYINSLAADTEAALFTNSLAITHPSQPNYLYLFSGSSQSVIGDIPPFSFQLPFSAANLGAELLAAGKTFTGYAEDLPSVGYTGSSSGNYVGRHCPWIYWVGTGTNALPAATDQPYTSFPTNYNNLPTVSFVIPNLQDDMHDGTITQGDTWLQNNIDGYVQWAKTHNSLLILTFDEDENSIGSSTPITTIFVGQMVKAGQYSEQIDHNRVLRTIEDMYGLTYAGASSTQTPITDCWVYKPVSALSATPTSICSGDAIALTDASQNTPLGWQWVFPGGTPATAGTQTPPTVTYNTGGTYDVELITYNHMGYDTLVKHGYITVQQRPTITLASNNVDVCLGDTNRLIATGANSINWLQGPGQISNSGNFLTISPTSNVTYYVTGTNNGCGGDTASVAVAVHNVVTPTVNITTSATGNECAGTNISFNAQSTNGGNTPAYFWKVNGSTVSGNTATYNTSNLANGDTVTCLLSSTEVCARPAALLSNAIVLAIQPPYGSVATAGICIGDSYPFHGQNLTNAGNYYDTLTSVTGCDSIITLQLAVNNLPNVTWGGTDTVSVTNNAVQLAGANPPGGTFSGTQVNGNTFDAAAAGTGTYTITYTYTDGNGCVNSATRNYFVTLITGEKEVLSSKIALYPNPASGQLFVEGLRLETGSITVCNINGQNINLPSAKNNNQIVFDVSTLPAGVYYLKLNTQGETAVSKFVKQ